MLFLRSRLLFAAAVIGVAVVAQAQDSPQRKELRRVDLSGAAGMEVISSISEFKPGDELPRHLHHGVEARPLRRSSIFAMWFTADLR
jgi:hypothetical protein